MWLPVSDGTKKANAHWSVHYCSAFSMIRECSNTSVSARVSQWKSDVNLWNTSPRIAKTRLLITRGADGLSQEPRKQDVGCRRPESLESRQGSFLGTTASRARRRSGVSTHMQGSRFRHMAQLRRCAGGARTKSERLHLCPTRSSSTARIDGNFCERPLVAHAMFKLSSWCYTFPATRASDFRQGLEFPARA